MSVYTMRMSRVNITVPDDVVAQAKAAGLNVSRLATAALVEELDRRSKIAALDACLAELDRALGPIPHDEREAWVDELAAPRSTTRSGPRRRRSA
jgi:post-segregation antitoxin (ccd killing protein)